MSEKEIEKFTKERLERIHLISEDESLKELGVEFLQKTGPLGYTYNFSWLGRPIIQFPQDMIAIQELIWELKPDLVIETGIAHGGSLIFSASILEIIGKGEVLGIDIDIRKHNRKEIENHRLYSRINMVEGSSIDMNVVKLVEEHVKDKECVLVLLDSNHTHDHVLSELNIYSKFVTPGSYCVVFDTAIEDMPEDHDWGDREWGKGNNPKTAVWEFLNSHENFEIDEVFNNKLLVTVAPDGYLKRLF